jgi:predicted nucleic acid-binding protein
MNETKATGRTVPSPTKATLSELLQRAEAGEEVVISKAGKPVATFGQTAKSPRTFLDTNVLVYAEDMDYPIKQRIAKELIYEHLRSKTGVVSLQVLQEFFVNVTRKLKVDVETARFKVEFHSRFHVAEPSVADILAAIDLHRLHGYSYWDSLVLRMAKQTGCRVLLTEDMQHGQEFDGMRIINPFL